MSDSKNKNSRDAALTYREHNPYWTSSLFSDVYLRNDVPTKYKSIWENDSEFEEFRTKFQDLVSQQSVDDANTWSESDTIANWIVPLMTLLGWQDKSSDLQTQYMTEVSLSVPDDGKRRTYRLDLAFVDLPENKKYIKGEEDPDKRLREARDPSTGIQIVVEAKYWDRLEEYRQQRNENKKRVPKSSEDDTKALSPNDQILKYLEVVQNDFGILTDGKTWRLFHREQSKGDIRRYFEFDVGNLAELVRGGLLTDARSKEFYEQAKYFFFLFRKKAFIQSGATTPLCFEILEYSRKYASDIEEDLKKRFIQAMGYFCNSMWDFVDSSDPRVDLGVIRDAAESHLFNILFIRSCETRKILPLHASDYLRVSLAEIIECLDFMRFDPDKDPVVYLKYFKRQFGEDFSFDGYQIYDRLMKLYTMVQEGNVGFGIHGFKESVFGDVEWKYACSVKVTNLAMIRSLFSLSFVETSGGARKYQQIPYGSFTPRQLGSIYESFLEFKLDRADCDMIFRGGQWKAGNPDSAKAKSLALTSDAVVRSGDLFFTPDNLDRRVSGAYYTPEFVVDQMVNEVLQPICDAASYKAIASLAVCDPAVGSGHFLNTALQYLTFRYREKFVDETLDDIHETFEDTARTILHSCIYGVDINPRAVKLARLSLWLTTASINRKLERLSTKITCGNSVIADEFNWELAFPEIKKAGGFDVLLGNPPYVDSERMIASDPEGRKKIAASFKTAKGNWDLYIPFIEFGLGKLKKGGTLSFIVPSKWIAVDYAKALREHIRDDLTTLIDCDAVKVFDAGNNPIVLILTRGSKAPSIVKKKFNNLRQIESSGSCQKTDLKDDWGVLLAKEGTALESVRRHKTTVSDKYAVENPFSVAEAYEIKEILADRDFDSAKDYRFVNTGTIDRFVSLWGTKPTTYIKAKYDHPVVRKRDFKASFPKRVSQCEDRKIIITGMRYFECYLDSEGGCIAGKSTIIVRGGSGAFDLDVLVGILNSKLVTFYLHCLYSTQGIDGGINFTTKMVAGIPLPSRLEAPSKLKLSVKKLTMAYEASVNGATTIKNLAEMETELNTLVYQMYGLSAEDIEEVEAFFRSKKKKRGTAA